MSEKIRTYWNEFLPTNNPVDPFNKLHFPDSPPSLRNQASDTQLSLPFKNTPEAVTPISENGAVAMTTARLLTFRAMQGGMVDDKLDVAKAYYIQHASALVPEHDYTFIAKRSWAEPKEVFDQKRALAYFESDKEVALKYRTGKITRERTVPFATKAEVFELDRNDPEMVKIYEEARSWKEQVLKGVPFEPKKDDGPEKVYVPRKEKRVIMQERVTLDTAIDELEKELEILQKETCRNDSISREHPIVLFPDHYSTKLAAD